ncbi:MAG: FAD-dependent thymidylate synthase [Anaerolineae bacterium]|nr:FAD-dependent thymidylate synthase [Anaerolineae bacterium]
MLYSHNQKKENTVQVKLIAITRYLDQDSSPEALIERAGRVCYKSQTKETTGKASAAARARFIQHRIKEGHESIIEHASATFEISGISRAASHQLVRHRIASYSQESQRYVDMSDPEWVVPPDIAASQEAADLWDKATDQVRQVYRQLRELGIKKEDARFLLPNAAATRIVVTMNFRELLHVFRIRISPHAQWEIRAMCVQMLTSLLPHAPNVFGPLASQLEDTFPSFFQDTAPESQ